MLKNEIKEQKHFTSDDVENLILSVRLHPDRLNFIISDIATEKTLYSDTIKLSKSISYLSDITDAMFANDVLRLEYKKVFVYVNPTKWCVIPSDLYNEDKAYLWLRSITEYNTEAKNAKVLAHKMTEYGKVLIYDLDKEIYALINRTLNNPIFMPYIAKTIEQTRNLKINAQNGVNCISLNSHSIDFVSFNNGSIFRCCNFLFTDIHCQDSFIDEIIYFVACLYNSSPFDVQNDCIVIFYNNDISASIDMEQLKHRLRGYSQNIILNSTNI